MKRVENCLVEHEEDKERDTGGHAQEQAALHDIAEHDEIFGAKSLRAKCVESRNHTHKPAISQDVEKGHAESDSGELALSYPAHI